MKLNIKKIVLFSVIITSSLYNSCALLSGLLGGSSGGLGPIANLGSLIPSGAGGAGGSTLNKTGGNGTGTSLTNSNAVMAIDGNSNSTYNYIATTSDGGKVYNDGACYYGFMCSIPKQQ